MQLGSSLDCNNRCSSACGLLLAQNGNISDGSGALDYQNNAYCQWMIAPNIATFITLRFSKLSTQLGIDVIDIFQCEGAGSLTSLRLAALSGFYSTPVSVTSTTGCMYVTFSSDATVTYDGFNASWITVGNFLANLLRLSLCLTCMLLM
jgi:hypothetical protein